MEWKWSFASLASDIFWFSHSCREYCYTINYNNNYEFLFSYCIRVRCVLNAGPPKMPFVSTKLFCDCNPRDSSRLDCLGESHVSVARQTGRVPCRHSETFCLFAMVPFPSYKQTGSCTHTNPSRNVAEWHNIITCLFRLLPCCWLAIC